MASPQLKASSITCDCTCDISKLAEVEQDLDWSPDRMVIGSQPSMYTTCGHIVVGGLGEQIHDCLYGVVFRVDFGDE
ncbi:hypothetical protein RRG08_060156 [Elysia crispata]|uniref:Uncharacterized protein n=1 Tax=Elysia crispata TaxID=231223 RepID=A0AAE1DPM2_9GAST|nr:hypothetical protein RRG08_060156 [Elysia crispata]